MANASVSGLVSGLDTATIISQLMQVEANPQTLLKSKVSSEKTSLSSLQSLNAKLLTIATKANDLAKVASWSPFTTTSSSDKVTARVLPGSTPGSVSFTVKQTATAHQERFAVQSLDSRVTDPASTKVQVSFNDGTQATIETGDGTLRGLVNGINSGNFGLRATTIDVGGGNHRVVIESARTGTVGKFTLATNVDDPATAAVTETLPLALTTTPVDGLDAKIDVGGDIVTSSTNTFANKISGLDITLSPGVTTNTAIEITVARDTKAMTDSMQALVDAANAVLTDISSLTAYKTSTTAGGALAGDATLRSLRQELLSSVTGDLGTTSLADVGVELDRYGKITFDAKVFEAAYAADPTGTANRFAATATWADSGTADQHTGTATLAGFTWRTQAGTYAVDSATGMLGGHPATVSGTLLTGKSGTPVDGLAVSISGGTAVGTVTYAPGFAARLAAIAERASDSTVGTVTASINGRTSSIESLEDAIAGWDVRLTKRRESLQRQYAALEVALGQLQNQSQWLAGQIAGLPSYSSGS